MLTVQLRNVESGIEIPDDWGRQKHSGPGSLSPETPTEPGNVPAQTGPASPPGKV